MNKVTQGAIYKCFILSNTMDSILRENKNLPPDISKAFAGVVVQVKMLTNIVEDTLNEDTLEVFDQISDGLQEVLNKHIKP